MFRAYHILAVLPAFPAEEMPEALLRPEIAAERLRAAAHHAVYGEMPAQRWLSEQKPQKEEEGRLDKNRPGAKANRPKRSVSSVVREVRAETARRVCLLFLILSYTPISLFRWLLFSWNMEAF